MVADVFSHLCIIPTVKTVMTNHEMVMTDLNYLLNNIDSNARQHRRAVTADFLFAESNGNGDREEGEEQEADLGPINENEFNPEHQPLHPDEDMIRGKLVINVPAFTASDLYQIRVCSKVRKYLKDGTVDGNHRFHKAVERLAAVCFIQECILYQKCRTILREVCEDYNTRREVLHAAHDGALHCGVENTMVYLTSHFWFPQMEKFVCCYIAQCTTYQRYAKAGPISQFPNYAYQISDILTHWNVDFAGPFPEDLFGY